MRNKRLSASGIAVVALSVLLVLSVSVGATLAWFASQSAATGDFALGEPVIVSVTDIGGSDTTTLAMTIASENLLPGMRITPDIAVTLAPSTTATILRARLDSVATGGGGTPEELNQQFIDVLTDVIDEGWVLNEDDGWYYYLGNTGADAREMLAPAETSGLATPEFGATTADYDDAVTAPRTWEADKESTVLASVVPGAAAKTIGFLTEGFRLPTTITNEYAGTEINISFFVEALQDYLVIGDTNVLTSLDNATTLFNEISTYVAG